MRIETRLAEMGLELPAPLALPAGVRMMWRQVRVVGTRAVIAGHGPRNLDGSPAGPAGQLGAELTIEQGYAAARSTALGVIGDLQRELGDLDRIESWVRVLGMVNSAPGFVAQAPVIDGFTDLMIAVFGEDAALCPRAVGGMAQLPFGSPVIIEGEVQLVADRDG